MGTTSVVQDVQDVNVYILDLALCSCSERVFNLLVMRLAECVGTSLYGSTFINFTVLEIHQAICNAGNYIIVGHSCQDCGWRGFWWYAGRMQCMFVFPVYDMYPFLGCLRELWFQGCSYKPISAHFDWYIASSRKKLVRRFISLQRFFLLRSAVSALADQF